jgi:hypothetical protein
MLKIPVIKEELKNIAFQSHEKILNLVTATYTPKRVDYLILSYVFISKNNCIFMEHSLLEQLIIGSVIPGISQLL